MFRYALFVLVVMVGTIVAQEAPMMSQHFKPGDPLHYYVRFDGNPELTGLTVSFQLQEEMKKDQAGFSSGFTLSGMKSVSPGLFEVNGTIPNNAATGKYQLIQVTAVHSPAGRSYNYPKDFSEKVTIEIVNDAGYNFPPIKSISPNPPK
ncbi:MAG: hypothetical protein LAN63_10230 [Acidobacteriia bacterium]|nr:hypothetical protein [Terriglobia bacterium]